MGHASLCITINLQNEWTTFNQCSLCFPKSRFRKLYTYFFVRHCLRSRLNSCVFRLQAVGTALTDSAHESISGQKQSAKVEPGYDWASLFLDECICLSWCHEELVLWRFSGLLLHWHSCLHIYIYIFNKNLLFYLMLHFK